MSLWETRGAFSSRGKASEREKRIGMKAQRACDFILDVERQEEEGPAEPQPKEFKVTALRECPVPDAMQVCETPQQVADYWQLHSHQSAVQSRM